MLKTYSRLALAAVFAFAGTGSMAGPIVIDTSNASNGIYNIYSASFDGPLTACSGGSPSYCSFFGGDDPFPSGAGNLTASPNPTGVTTGVPGNISPAPVAGSFLNLDLTGGNTLLTFSGGTIIYPALTVTITHPTLGVTTVGASGAGMKFFDFPPVIAPVNGSGQAEFLVNTSPALAVDFSTIAPPVVTSCSGALCGSLGGFTFDMVRYRLFIDYDPTFTSFTGDFIGQTSNNTMIFATLNSGNPYTLIPVPAAVWLMGSALGLLGWVRRKASA